MAIGRLFSSEIDTTNATIVIEEVQNDASRHDIVLDLPSGKVIIEAKFNFSQNALQIKKYLKAFDQRRPVSLVLIDRGSFHVNSWLHELPASYRKRITFVTWTIIHKALSKLMLSRNEKHDRTALRIAEELISYMEAEGMVRNNREIYVRDLSGDSIALFFKYHIYKSQPKFFKSAEGNRYFAPYFTGKAPDYFTKQSLIRVEPGISWMAPIKEIDVVTKPKFLTYLKYHNHHDPKGATREIMNETPSKELILLTLGEPFLAFLTPISKKKLGIKGSMGSRNFTFEDLYRAASKGD
ncbi:MAG: hypothetical protein AABZ39_13145 [Spirochaetota bacterium]